MTNNIGAVDYAILSCIAEQGKAWKKRIHERVNSRIEEFPHIDMVSVQTIGRHVNDLQERGAIESCIMSPDELSRDLIIGYEITQDGHTLREDRRRQFLQNAVVAAGPSLLSEDAEPSELMGKPAFAALMVEEFDLPDTIRQTEIANCDLEALMAVVAVYYFRQNISSIVTGNAEDVFAIVNSSEKLRENYCRETFVTRIRRRLMATIRSDVGRLATASQ